MLKKSIIKIWKFLTLGNFFPLLGFSLLVTSLLCIVTPITNSNFHTHSHFNLFPGGLLWPTNKSKCVLYIIRASSEAQFKEKNDNFDVLCTRTFSKKSSQYLPPSILRGMQRWEEEYRCQSYFPTWRAFIYLAGSGSGSGSGFRISWFSIRPTHLSKGV